jgi:hypothetical protein
MREPDIVATELGDGWTLSVAGYHRDRSGALFAAVTLAGGTTPYIQRIGLTDPAQVAAWAAAATRHGPQSVAALIDALLSLQPEVIAQLQRGGVGDTQPNRLVVLSGQFDLFHCEDDSYARVQRDGHQEVHAVRSTAFRRVLQREYYATYGGAPSSQGLHDAVGVVDSRARFDGEERAVYVRVAEVDGHIYLDLCDSAWRVVEITAGGWRVLDESPVMFRRAVGMQALPMPAAGGSVDQLRPFINVPDGEDGDDKFRLIVAWTIAALRGDIPYPALAIQGEQGSAKSTTARIIRSLVDPNHAALRSPAREERDLVIAATNGHVVAFDNLSTIPQWLSDALCRICTGGGYATRQLYSDASEVIFDVRKPVLFTGIVNPATAGDLLDRCIIVDLPPIASERRQLESQIWPDFERLRPGILGALLDAVSGALRRVSTTRLHSAPRMADFAHWATAAEETLGWPPGSFMKAYSGNRKEGAEYALEASPIVDPLRRLLDARADGWSGGARELLAALEGLSPDARTQDRTWPKTPQGLAAALKRLAPDLRSAGIAVEQMPRGHGGRRTWRLDSVQRRTSPTSPTSRVESDSPESGDDESSHGSALLPRCHQAKFAPGSGSSYPGDEGDIGDMSFRSSSEVGHCSHCGTTDGTWLDDDTWGMQWLRAPGAFMPDGECGVTRCSQATCDWTVKVQNPHPRAIRPLAEHGGLCLADAMELAAIYRALGHSLDLIAVSAAATNTGWSTSAEAA